MAADLDTLLTALYVELTDRIIPALGFARSGPGRQPQVTDAELVCLAVAQVLRYDDERHWLRATPKQAGRLFPPLPLVLGIQAAADLHLRRDRDRVLPGQPETVRGTAASPPGPGMPAGEPPGAWHRHRHRQGPGRRGNRGVLRQPGPRPDPDPPACKDEKTPRPLPNWPRQRVEAIIWTRQNQLGLERHGGRVLAGL
jgi:hypothetical protein